MAYPQRHPPPGTASGGGGGGGRPPPPQAEYFDQGYDGYGGYDDPYAGGHRNGGMNDGYYPASNPPMQDGYGDGRYGSQDGQYDRPVDRPPPLRQAAEKSSQWPLGSSSGDFDMNKGFAAMDINHGNRPHTSNADHPAPPSRQQTAPLPSSARPPPIPEAGRRTADPFGQAPQSPAGDDPLMQAPKRSATMPIPEAAAPPASGQAQYPGKSTWQEPTKSSKHQSVYPANDILDDYLDSLGNSEPDMPNFDAMSSSGAGDDRLIPGESSRRGPSHQDPKDPYSAYRPGGGGMPEQPDPRDNYGRGRYDHPDYQFDHPPPPNRRGPPPADYYGYPPEDQYMRRPDGRGMPPPRPGPRGGFRGRGRPRGRGGPPPRGPPPGRGRGGGPPRPPPKNYGGPPPMRGNGGQERPPPGGDRGYGDPRDMQMGGPPPDQGGADPPQNPDALPQHPAPYRPGLGQGSSKPPPMRQHDNQPPAQAQQPPPQDNLPPQEGDRPGSGIITHEELRLIQQEAREKPSDQHTQLTLAKKLVEASVHLIDDNGRADSRTKNKNRERYIFDAHKIVKKLVNGGYGEAMFYLADCYGQGLLGLETDPKEAFALYQSAAKLGHGEAAYRLAVCCEMGHEGGGGTRRDPMKGVQWYRRAAALGNTPAMYKMGIILLKGLLGQQKNPREALSWLKRAAERANEENPHALHELALLYDNPQGNDAVIRDEGYALELLMQAADLEYKFSQFRLGAAYEHGALGCPIDPRQSIFWYTRAAAQEEHQSELALSGWYLTGADGILQQSDTEAYLWARKAAMAGLPKAEYAMGYFSEVGIGSPANLEDAKRWYFKASSQNFMKARERLEDLRRGGAAKMQKTRVSRSAVSKQSEGDCVVM